MEYHEEGHSIRETAKIFSISPNTLNAWLEHITIAESLSENTEAIKRL
ncbi:MAG: helix-turn-helix domain containing protein [Clostridiales bacterium]|nr:helix-turn-helix domain containing protein [Clostridiales bacterium]